MTTAKTVQQLYQVGSTLPPSALAELLDFAEFLQQKCVKLPIARRGSLAELRGGLENSTAFSGDPLTIQKSMRREWD